MEIYRPLRMVLFTYDLIRLIVMIGFLTSLMPLWGGGENGFPHLVYMVPNALFPLMTLFLRANLNLHRAYLPLYMAGKSIAAGATVGWMVFSLARIDILSLLNNAVFFAGLACTVFFALADMGTILGARVLLKGLRKADAERFSGETAEEGPGIPENGGK
ncbi:MAG: hypothetical protein LBP32_01010 [Spirochaetaceae bacterium]|jgi:hypothetical protein|nr:hypothetical protein [Spirochaetaceae bacterium]